MSLRFLLLQELRLQELRLRLRLLSSFPTSLQGDILLC